MASPTNTLTAEELASLQADAVALMDQTCTITRETVTPSSIGADASAVTVASGVPCLVARPSTALLMALDVGKVGNAPQWVVSLPVGTDVRAGDVLTLAGDSGDALIVQSVTTPVSYEVLHEALCSEVR